jgi:hypothetical protein
MATLEIVIALAALPFLSLYWLHMESPKWLLSVGKWKCSFPGKYIRKPFVILAFSYWIAYLIVTGTYILSYLIFLLALV